MEKVEKTIKENLNDICTHTNSDNDSVYTHHFKPFTISIKFVKKIKLSKILNRGIQKEKDENVFLFKVEYSSEGNNHIIEWEIYKSYQKIKNLFILSRNYLNSEGYLKNDLYLLSHKFEFFINSDSKEISRKYYLLVEFFNELKNISKLKDQIFFLEFFEISRYTLDCITEGNKPKEGYILKRAESKRKTAFAIVCCCLFCKCSKWKKKWFVLRDDMICYMRDSSSAIGKDIFWFDQELILLRDFNNVKNSLCVVNGSRKLNLKFEEEYERDIWFDIISQKVKDYQFSVKNIYNSFANEKQFCNAKWYIDADNYFNDLYESLITAKETIYIAGWWVSPEIFLKRPISIEMYRNNQKKPVKNGVRLMDVLMEKAEVDVKIHILVFKEVTLALPIDSSHTKDILNNLHINIKVTRHPKNKMDLLWSHHEKIVIIDEEIAYTGGIDLCWGRYDTSEHKLNEPPVDEGEYSWPGIDYSNIRKKEFENIREYHKSNIERITTPRMPWHDIAVCLEGPVVTDLCRHFVERWNYARMATTGTFTKDKKHTIVKIKKQSKSIFSSFLIAKSLKEKDSGSDLNTPLLRENEKYESYTDSPLDDTFINFLRADIPVKIERKEDLRKVQDIIVEEKSDCDSDHDLEEIKFKQRNTFVGLNNPIKKESKTANVSPDKAQRRNTTILPPKEERIIEPITIVNDQHDKNQKKNKKKFKSRKSIFEKIKGAYSKMKEKIKTQSNVVLNKFGRISNLIDDNKLLNIKLNDSKVFNQNDFTMSCQVLRSASNWSIGLKQNENSILQGYYNLIDNSKHYILIENQFFVSRSFSEEEYLNAGLTGSYPIINEIALRIRKRIEKAYSEGQKFRVFVLIPLLPGFEGEVTDSATMKLILKYTYKTISRNRGFSLLEKLYQLMQDKYEDYIQFFSLRTHSTINKIPHTELIYIHSKMMIVDDEVVLIGSANINDRSMLGFRDTEIAVIIRELNEENKKMSQINGNTCIVSKFAQSLRIQLFKEYMGISDLEKNVGINDLLDDPLSDKLFKFMKEIARSNTMYYREIFNVYPDDKFMSYSDILFAKDKNNQDTMDNVLAKYEQNSNKIVGYIVEFPLNFLKEENLKISYFCKEILVPIKNFL